MQLQANAALEQTVFDPNEMVLWLVHFQAKENSKEDEAVKERFRSIFKYLTSHLNLKTEYQNLTITLKGIPFLFYPLVYLAL